MARAAGFGNSSESINEPSFGYCLPDEGPETSADYRDLLRQLRQAGLFDRQYGFYVVITILTWSQLILGFALLRDHHLYLLAAVYLAFVYGQLGFLGHDGAHGEIFRKWRHSHIFCLAQRNLLMGLSTGWWTQKHNLHHSNPNCITLDGELEIAALAFTPEQALSRSGIMKTLAKYQAYTFFPLLAMTALALRLESLQFVFRSRPRHYIWEASLLVLHFIVYGSIVYSSLGLYYGLLFVLVHQVLFGLYMSSAAVTPAGRRHSLRLPT